MHFVTGGAFNGKRAWVKDTYAIREWISAYDRKHLLNDCSILSGEVIVLEGLEIWTKELALKLSLTEAREHLRRVLDDWDSWEKAVPKRRMVLIGTDITKGIVPMSEDDRNWRDLTGWFYQDIVGKSEKVDIIWYGINQTIKGEN